MVKDEPLSEDVKMPVDEYVYEYISLDNWNELNEIVRIFEKRVYQNITIEKVVVDYYNEYQRMLKYEFNMDESKRQRVVLSSLKNKYSIGECIRYCKLCGECFTPSLKHRKYCSVKCREEYWGDINFGSDYNGEK